MLLTTSAGCLAIGFSGTFTHFLRNGFKGFVGIAFFCVSSKVSYLAPFDATEENPLQLLKQIGAH
jgi:hypothetical protein